MKRLLTALVASIGLVGVTNAYAQETGPGPGTVEVTIIPGGATFFTSQNSRPSFGNYNLGGAVTYNINRIVGIEGEVGGSLGISQNLAFAGVTGDQKTPNMLNYSGNVVVSYPAGQGFFPYATGGIGGTTLYSRAQLGVVNTDTFLTSNVGGGLKWYAQNGKWGLRGDYRFLATKSKDGASAFFGQDTTYGHRVYGAVIINALR
jgi:hypothetical protein